jgi:hypothetical protein
MRKQKTTKNDEIHFQNSSEKRVRSPLTKPMSVQDISHSGLKSSREKSHIHIKAIVNASRTAKSRKSEL